MGVVLIWLVGFGLPCSSVSIVFLSFEFYNIGKRFFPFHEKILLFSSSTLMGFHFFTLNLVFIWNLSLIPMSHVSCELNFILFSFIGL